MSSVASASVSRDAVPLPIAISSTPWRATSAASVAFAASHCCWLMREDRAGVHHLAGAVDDGDLDPGPEARIEAEGGAVTCRGREQEVLEVRGEHRHGVLLGT